jgi:hypothetical protein
MRCKECQTTEDEFEMVMFKIRVEEDKILSLYQCMRCKRVVVATGEEEEI